MSDDSDVEVDASRQPAIACGSASAGSKRTSIDAGRIVRSLRLEDGTQFSLAHHREGTTHEIYDRRRRRSTVEIIDPLAANRRKRGEDDIGDSGIIKALMPGRIVRVLVAKGDEVARGAGLLDPRSDEDGERDSRARRRCIDEIS